MKKKKGFLTLLLAVVTLLGINSSVLKAKEEKIKTNTEFVEKKDFEIPKNYLKSTGNSSIIGSGSYYKYFSSSSWIKRGGKWCLSIKPTNHLRYTLSKSIAVSAWHALVDVHSRDYQWKNTKSMEAQFYCHCVGGKIKSSWNLEPWRTKVGPLCNDPLFINWLD